MCTQAAPNYLVAHPTDRGCGLVHPGDFNGISGGKSSTYIWGYNPLTIRGMNHQVGIFL